MRTRTEVSAEKLRGGFYSPAGLVNLCLDRVEALVTATGPLSLLEPSAGDGAFVRALSHHGLSTRIRSVTALEPLHEEAAKCDAALEATGIPGRTLRLSAVGWAGREREQFDVAVGNPPFVRFQFLSDEDKRDSITLGEAIDVSFRGVSNLWVPVLLGALSRLRSGGVFAFIVPAECFTGISAGAVRRWLLEHVDDLRCDLFPAGSFPSVLQEVVVLSGRRALATTGAASRLRVYEHGPSDRQWEHMVSSSTPTWTRYLLTPQHVRALDEAALLPVVRDLGSVARFEVATVTGANEFFSVDDETLKRYSLSPWALPLLPRLRNASGLVFSEADHREGREGGMRGWLLHFAKDRPDPSEDAKRYLGIGRSLGLPLRYKCRIREPWYRVPVVPAGQIMLSKRSHRFPRLVLNRANAVTTDTIYRGRMLPAYRDQAETLVASFHNSLTLLTAEIEGRSFGGGVLELVPSEVGRLLVPLPDGFDAELAALDSLMRSGGATERLVEETDLLLVKAQVGLTQDLLDTCRDARLTLLGRRMDRNAASPVHALPLS